MEPGDRGGPGQLLPHPGRGVLGRECVGVRRRRATAWLAWRSAGTASRWQRVPLPDGAIPDAAAVLSALRRLDFRAAVMHRIRPGGSPARPRCTAGTVPGLGLARTWFPAAVNAVSAAGPGQHLAGRAGQHERAARPVPAGGLPVGRDGLGGCPGARPAQFRRTGHPGGIPVRRVAVRLAGGEAAARLPAALERRPMAADHHARQHRGRRRADHRRPGRGVGRAVGALDRPPLGWAPCPARHSRAT